MVSPAACSVSFVAYSIVQLRFFLLFVVCAFLFLVCCLCLFGVSAPRAGLLGGGVAACVPAYGECEACAVCAGSVVASQGGEGELCGVSVYHDEDGVHFVSVMVVVVLRVFDVGVHDAGGVVAALVGVFEVIPAVHASHAAFVAFDGERVAVVEGEGGGAYFVVADGDVGDVSASENLCVFFCRAVLVEGDFVGVHGWFLPFSSAGSYVRAWWVWCA